jgi:NAD(P) transhydrogenase
MSHYDMLVIGSGPAGQKAAIQAAKIGKKVGIIERTEIVGGICINTGTIPSKSLREAVLYLSGFRQRHLYGSNFRVKADVTLEDLSFRCHYVMKAEREVIRNQLLRNQVDFISGTASFIDKHRVRAQHGPSGREYSADFIVIAVGTEPCRPPGVPFDSETVIDSENGFLIPTRDVDALENAMRRFIDDPSLIASMGLASRRLVEQRFDVRRVNHLLLHEMGIEPEPVSITDSRHER